MYYATRAEMATDLIRRLGLKVGVEVGIYIGTFSKHLLDTTDIKLHGVDIDLKQEAKAVAGQYDGRYILHKGDSPLAAQEFADNSFDFVHIDAGHTDVAVREDLEAWWPKLRSGGLFSGDDYACVVSPHEGPYGVVEVVNWFMMDRKLDFYVTGVMGTTDLAHKCKWAEFVGKQTTCYFRKQPYFAFQDPAWYCIKP